ncbi:effector binding domain-containing protein [Pseudobacillus sp. FSL P4-0506]|uniref:GyrI-like domain-containing protein n=1 Tax=unclassified Pseudobacillus TaxID=2619284 RepID=UPI0030FB08E9
MIPKVVEIEEIKVIGLQKTCQTTDLETEKAILWKQFKQFASDILDQTNGELMEICRQKQGSLVTHCVALEVNNVDIVPAGMISFNIPPQSYIYMKHNGYTHTLWKSLNEIKQWAKEHHCRLDPNQFMIHVKISEEPPVHELYVKLEDKKRESTEIVV